MARSCSPTARSGDKGSEISEPAPLVAELNLAGTVIAALHIAMRSRMRWVSMAKELRLMSKT